MNNYIEHIREFPLADLTIVAIAVVDKVENTEGDLVTEVSYEVLDDAAWVRFGTASGTINTAGRCACCNHNLTYACIVEHAPTGLFYSIGRDCAASIQCLQDNLASADAFITLTAKNRAQIRKNHAEALRRDAALERFFEINQDLVAPFAWAQENKASTDRVLAFEIATLNDLRSKARQYGSLSEKQLAFAIRLHDKALEKIEASKAKAEQARSAIVAGITAPEGRQQVTGTILNIKDVESDFGVTTKCLIDLGNGTRVWGSLPSSAQGSEYVAASKLWVSAIEKGDVVTLTATFEVSSKDVLFGFYKRPSKWSNATFAKRLAEAEAAQEAVAA